MIDLFVRNASASMAKPSNLTDDGVVRSRSATRQLAWDVWVLAVSGPGFGLMLPCLDACTYLLAWAFAGRELYQFDDVWEIQSARTSKLLVGQLILGTAIGIVLLFARAVMFRRLLLRVYLPVTAMSTLVTFLLINLILIQHDPYTVSVQWIASCALAAVATMTGLLAVIRLPRRRR